VSTHADKNEVETRYEVRDLSRPIAFASIHATSDLSHGASGYLQNSNQRPVRSHGSGQNGILGSLILDIIDRQSTKETSGGGLHTCADFEGVQGKDRTMA